MIQKLNINFLKNFWSSLSPRNRKIFYFGAAILLVIVFSVIGKKQSFEEVSVSQRVISDFIQATGEVTSEVDLDLAFQVGGYVDEIRKPLGSVVKEGDIIATLELLEENATLTKARGALLKAEAEYEQALSITSGEDIAKLELELENEKARQDILVDNAYRTLLSSDLEAVPTSSLSTNTPPTITGVFTGGIEGDYKVYISLKTSSPTNGSFHYTGLEKDLEEVSIVAGKALPLGTYGLYIEFPDDFSYGESDTDWVISIPNKKSSSYTTNYNAYILAQNTREQTISELEADLEIKKQETSNGDTKIAYANLVSAQGDYQSALASYEKGVIRAPVPGKVTRVSIKPGELVQSFESVVSLLDEENLYIEAKINESSVSHIREGQGVVISLDALPGDSFEGHVVSVDSSPTPENNVVNYVVKIFVDSEDINIKPGMTATLSINIDTEDGVLSIPRDSVYYDGTTSYVYVDNGKKTRDIKLGSLGDETYVEVIEGLSIGEKVYRIKD
ncbi:efflux RND transporter periplasmic adaptor subunit [Candidatus Nomurabacteria bacterium]|nr:efflux RND transporter periplasmic adaptor subunit [Candidatus Nomurabacteria bacterium]USN94560.1 MAG: efflux RND transporter periplasmic adaptor subunit [Candidatus Nomurabacteria bacterium]